MPLSAIPLTVSPLLAGTRQAVRFGNGPLHVSQELFDLIKQAGPEQLQKLLAAVKILQMPAMPGMFETVPMRTQEGHQ